MHVKSATKLNKEQAEFCDSHAAFEWNKVLMSSLGLWPAAPSDILFFLTFGYFCYEMALEYLDLLLHIDNLEHVLLNLTENVAFSEIFIRILTLRLYNRDFNELIAECNKDFDTNDYSEQERKAFSAYHVKSRLFMKLLISNTAFTATSYYMKPFLGQIGEITDYFESKSGNATFVYLLPYRFHTFYELNSATRYFWTYLSQLPFVYVSWMGQSAADCLMVTLVYHVSGQMAVLASRITKLDTDPANCTDELHKLVRAHTRLLRMGGMIERAFSTMLLGHLVGATLLVCILGYQILACLANGETAILISLFSFIFLVLLVLYAHCTIGENLITESDRVCKAYYNCNWYNMSQKNASIIILCIARSQKPLQLSAGKFSMFCHTTLTEAIKASMGYLSVLRTIM